MVMMQNAGVNQDLEVARKVLIMQRAEWNHGRTSDKDEEEVSMQLLTQQPGRVGD